MGKIILIFLTLVTLLVVGVYAANFYMGQLGPTNKPITLTVWGTAEDESSIKLAAAAFKENHPNVTINYVPQNMQNYSLRVQNQISKGAGPDIFLLNSSWLPMYLQSGSVASAPILIMSESKFTSTFYPVAKDSLVYKGKVYAVPREVDGIALFYNEEMLKGQGLKVPAFWNEFVDDAVKMTIYDQNNNIVTSGAAIGTTNNVDYWSDILGLLFMQQPGTAIDVPNNNKGSEVLKFYTDFVKDNTKKTWNEGFDNSTQAFAQGKTAFYFAPSSKLSEIRKINPDLKFKTAIVPQLPGNKDSIAWGNFWAYAVSSKTTSQKDAWQFLEFLTSADVQRAMFNEAKKNTGFGKPYARIDMQQDLEKDLYLGAFVKQGPLYKTWYLTGGASDQALNDGVINTYKSVIDQVLTRGDLTGALNGASTQLPQITSNYPYAKPSK